MNMPGNPIIQCQQIIPEELPFDYPGKALDFTLGRGEVVSIIGPDFSAKGAWLRTICGLENQQTGKVYINGIDTSNLSAKDWTMMRMKVAYIHQDTALMSAANGLVNVLAPALYHQLDKALKDQLLAEKALDLLQEIDPDINLDDLPAYISKDHQFKIAVARALLLEPDVLALNNPFANFNHFSKRQFQDFLGKQVKKGLALLLVTHDVPYALNISDKFIFANRENLFYFDSKQALLNCDIAVVNDFINCPESQLRT